MNGGATKHHFKARESQILRYPRESWLLESWDLTLCRRLPLRSAQEGSISGDGERGIFRDAHLLERGHDNNILEAVYEIIK